MSNTRKLASTALVGAAVGTLLMMGNGHAVADPSPAPPPYRTYAAVGSDTTQSVWNGLSNGVGSANATITGVGSYDATGSTTIQTKGAGATFCRPVGSGNGVKALSAVWDPSYAGNAYSADCTPGGATVALTNDEVDFARSSSGPAAGSGLTYLPFARDAVAVATNPYTSGTAITTLSTAQLTAIYGGADDNTAGTGVTYDASTGLPKLKNHILHPLLPQAGSGTRKFFQAAINIPDSDMASYVNINPTTIENDGTALDTNGDLIPFSAAQWIAQQNGVQTDTTAGDSLLKVNGKTGYAGTAPNEKPGTLFGTKSGAFYNTPPQTGVGVFARDTYNVVPTAFFSGTPTQQTLITKLTGARTGNLGGAPARAVILKYGFGNLSYLGDPNYFQVGAFQH